MSSNLFKAGWYVASEDARMIDTNELVEQRLREAAVKEVQYEAEEDWGEEAGFSEGLGAENLDGLFAAEDNSAVLKSASLQEKEMLEQELAVAREELEMARVQADRMLSDAQDEINRLTAKAREEARSKGYEEGRRQGLDEIEALKQEYFLKEKELQREYEQKMLELEPAFVEHLTGIYEHIFKVDLSAYNKLVRHLLVDAIQKMGDYRNYIIHVSKEDYPGVSGAKEQLQEEAGAGGSGFEIVADVTLGRSQCVIETEGGVYDCSLGTELAELKRKLRLLSYQS
ncbi:MAG: hypothetical protein IJ409_02010 [Lachnospiraceae bacterium]|nr:hypothetical protein [Lachnospiraceae bacterium]